MSRVLDLFQRIGSFEQFVSKTDTKDSCLFAAISRVIKT